MMSVKSIPMFLMPLPAFNSTVMEWMVVARIRLDKQIAEAYALAFRKIFDHCSPAK